MKRNIGRIDRFIRMTIAAFLVLLILSNNILGNLAVGASVLALILFVTSVFGSSPIYSLLKISSAK